MHQFKICYHSHLNASQKTKPNIDFSGQAGSTPLQSAGSGTLFYLISIMLQLFTEDFGILQLAENAKTNSNIAGYHLVSRRLISTPSDVQLVYRCPKRSFILPPKYHVLVSNILSELLKCVMKKRTNINFKGQTWY